MRGIYHNFNERLEETNFFNHERKLSDDWYNGTTGIDPIDDAINDANKYGYAHHIIRLMHLSNVMTLSQLHPKEIYKWFMEMFVDSSDWVMVPMYLVWEPLQMEEYLQPSHIHVVLTI